MNPSKLRLSVIVLCHYGDRWIDACVSSLKDQSLSENLYEIILVNNGNSTPKLAKFKKEKNMRVVGFPENFGFAGGNNRALAYADSEIVLLMNQDTVAHYFCLETLLNAFDRYPHAGAISTSMIMVSTKDHIDLHAKSVDTTGYFKLTSMGYALYHRIDAGKNTEPTNFVSGNGLGFRKSVLEDIGNYLFDARLGSYAEDLDFSIRLTKTAWRMYVQPKAIVYHFRDDAFSGNAFKQLKKLISISSNRLRVYRNNLTTADFLKKLPLLLLGIPCKVARPDGDKQFHILRLILAFMLVPFIIAHFSVMAAVNDIA